MKLYVRIRLSVNNALDAVRDKKFHEILGLKKGYSYGHANKLDILKIYRF